LRPRIIFNAFIVALCVVIAVAAFTTIRHVALHTLAKPPTVRS
jgi:hypothetical protein